MNTKAIAALAVAAGLAATGVTVATADARTSAPSVVTPAQLAEAYNCVSVDDAYGVGTLADEGRIKSSVYVIPGDRTVIVKRDSYDALVGAVSTPRGDWTPSLRYVCTEDVPRTLNVAWS